MEADPADTDRCAFPAMGSEAEILVVGGRPGLAHQGRRRVEELERRWSRFLPLSEVSRLNQAAPGHWVAASADTVALVELAVEAWEVTGGLADPTVLGDVLRAGYTASLAEPRLAPPAKSAREVGSTLGRGCAGVEVDTAAGVVRLPVGVGFDPGGIGKGLAADLVVEELLAAGAAGACVNVGGDLRVAGRPPGQAAGWAVAVDDPWCDAPLVTLGLAEGAVATSSQLRRRWTGPDGRPAHHLIDPATGRPSTSPVLAATAVAAQGWQAEALAKAAVLAGAGGAAALLGALGATGLLFLEGGEVVWLPGLEDHLPEGTCRPAGVGAGGGR